MRFITLLFIIMSITIIMFTITAKENGLTENQIMNNLSTLNNATNNITTQYINPYTTEINTTIAINNIVYSGIDFFNKLFNTGLALITKIAYKNEDILKNIWTWIKTLAIIWILLKSIKPIAIIYVLIQEKINKKRERNKQKENV